MFSWFWPVTRSTFLRTHLKKIPVLDIYIRITFVAKSHLLSTPFHQHGIISWVSFWEQMWEHNKGKGEKRWQLSTQTSRDLLKRKEWKGRRRESPAGYWIVSSCHELPATFCIPEQTTSDLGRLDFHLLTSRPLRPNKCLRPHAYKSRGCQRKRATVKSFKVLIWSVGWLSKRSSMRQRTLWARRSTKPSPMRSWKRCMGFTSRWTIGLKM